PDDGRAAGGLPWPPGDAPPQLPAVLLRPADLADRHLDAAGRPGVARAAVDEGPALARPRVGRPVRPGHHLRAVRRAHRRPMAQAPDAARDADVGDAAGLRTVLPHRDGRRPGLAGDD